MSKAKEYIDAICSNNNNNKRTLDDHETIICQVGDIRRLVEIQQEETKDKAIRAFDKALQDVFSSKRYADYKDRLTEEFIKLLNQE